MTLLTKNRKRVESVNMQYASHDASSIIFERHIELGRNIMRTFFILNTVLPGQMTASLLSTTLYPDKGVFMARLRIPVLRTLDGRKEGNV